MPKGVYPGNKGRTAWNKGRTGYMSEEGKQRIKEANKIEFSVEKRKKWSEAKKGEKHWNWKGGITRENKRLRHSLEYKLWRESVFERDNYTCIWCLKRGVYLEADHIKPFAFFPELRFAIDNGRTLCKPCHETTETFRKRKHDAPRNPERDSEGQS